MLQIVAGTQRAGDGPILHLSVVGRREDADVGRTFFDLRWLIAADDLGRKGVVGDA